MNKPCGFCGRTVADLSEHIRRCSKAPRVLHKRVRVHCKSCDHVMRRHFERTEEPCTHCDSTDVEVRPASAPGVNHLAS